MYFRQQENVGWVGEVSLDLTQVVKRSLKLLLLQQKVGYTIKPKATQRLRCLLSKILVPGIDDRYFNGPLSYITHKVTPSQFNSFLSHVKTDLTSKWFAPTQTDREILNQLNLLESRIRDPIFLVKRHIAIQGAASSPGWVQINDWMADRLRDQNSIYYCWGAGFKK